MIKFIKLTRNNGCPIWINPNNINYFTETSSNCTKIVFVDSRESGGDTVSSILVCESADSIAGLLT